MRHIEKGVAMQLLRLELRGFKSFADKTTVKFSPGMTAIVGPNGSGKSNITDAMRWVLGESNVRNLRGQRSEDVIFSGTEKRKPVSAAEVTLVFDNSDNTLPVEYAEVAVTRRLYRTGESEFYINKKPCRLKDIHLLLADTGLGKDSMAIIGQNRVDAILNSKPEERRLIFEEVAGIARFKLNKEEAVRRIGTTERNMERVADLMAGLAEQNESLSEKAEATREYNQLSKERRVFDAVLALHEYRTADRLFTRQENDKLALEAEDVELQTETATIGAQEQTLQAEQVKDRVSLQQAENTYSELRRAEAESEGNIRFLKEQRKHLLKEAEEKKSALDELEASWEADVQQIQLLKKLIADDEAALVVLRAEKRGADERYREAGEALEAGRLRFRQAREEERVRREREMELISTVEKYRSEIAAADEESKRIEKNIADLYKEIGEADEELAAIRQGYELLCREEEEALKESRTQRDDKEQAQRDVRQWQQQQQKSRQQLQQAQGRAELLAQWAHQYEGYGEGTRNILKATQPWQKGIAGAVADLFTVDEQLSTAIEIALGGSVNHIVTDTAQTAAQAVAYLKKTQGGRVTFLPLETVQGRRLDSPAIRETHVRGLAVDCIAFSEEYRGIFTQLLGRVLVVDTLEQAIALQKKYHQRLSVVTLDGEQLQPGGSLTGGAVKRRRASVMSRKREARQLEELIPQLQKNIEECQQKIVICEGRIATADRVLAAAELRYRDVHLKKSGREATVKVAEERAARKKRVVSEEEIRRDTLKERLTLWRQSMEEAERQRAELFLVDGDENSEQHHEETLDHLQAEQQRAYEIMTKAGVAVMQAESVQDERRRSLAEKEQAVDGYELRRLPLYTAWNECRKRSEEELPDELQAAETKLSEHRQRIEEALLSKDTLYANIGERDNRLTELRERLHHNGERLRQVQRRLGDMIGQLTKYGNDRDQALTRLDELGYTRNEAAALHPEGGVADWKSERIRLTAAIDRLGPVNPNAIEEYEEAQQRLSFYEHQQQDLTEAKAQLETVIAEIDNAMAGQLRQVLEIVGARFQAVFSRLFGGGQAQIVVTDEENILKGGIDFYIQPPGKKRQQLSLLSGGERALTVIALLFSFLDYRPAPFCVLDEVDAALDEANVERFGRYLQTLGEDTQFIVVSHRKRTMEAAHVLQGVTMVERGVSRLLTVTLEDVKEDM